MSRIQLGLNVTDLDAAVDFYTKLFETAPRKLEPGYANFAIADPPLKLVLFETGTADERLNHLGVEVESTGEVHAAHERLTAHELDASAGENVECCYAVKDETWISDPDGADWEVYTVRADVDTSRRSSASTCCS